MKKMLKSIVAILAGFLTVGIVSVLLDLLVEKIGLLPPVTQPEAYMWWHLFIALVYRLAVSVLGGYVTALLAPQKPMKHVIILAVIGTIAGTLGTISNWDKAIMTGEWYPIALIVLSPVAIWLGGKLRLR